MEGYSVICTELDVASQGEIIEEAIENIKEAVELYVESAREAGMEEEVLDKLGISESDFKNGAGLMIPKIYRTEIPIKISQ